MPAKPSVNKCDEHNSMVNRHIGTAYDTVRIVAENLDDILMVGGILPYLLKYLGPYETAPIERPDGSPLEDGDYYLDTINNALVYYDMAEGIWLVVDPSEIIQARDIAVAAADAALVSEQAAAISESNASASELAASQSETNAASSESNALMSELNAATSETNARDSENAAQVSENASALSESNAAISETNAANSASAALTSENNAAQSETNAGSFATAAAQSAADAEAAFDNFTDLYLGAKAADPTVDNDGNPLQVGATYWNTTSNDLRYWNGASWDVPEQTAIQAANTAVAARDDAQLSETNAAASEAASLTSEQNALASEQAASTSESNASTSEANALSSEQAAALSESNAATSETNAGISEANALTSENKAYQWAEEAEDVEVEAGEYSAHHWANKAEASASIVTWQQHARKEAELNQMREQNGNQFAASGFVSMGKHDSTSGAYTPVNEGMFARTLDNNAGWANALGLGRGNGASTLAGTSETEFPVTHIAGFMSKIFGLQSGLQTNFVKFPEAPDGTVTYNSATGEVIQHADAATAFALADTSDDIEVVINRVDMFGAEFFLEEVSQTNPFVYPKGMIQSQDTSMNGITTTTSNRPVTYYAVYDGDIGSQGLGVDFWAATDEQKKLMVSDESNNIFMLDGNRLVQWRMRQRTIAGFGNGDWGLQNDYLRFRQSANTMVMLQGHLDGPEVYSGSTSSHNYYSTHVTVANNVNINPQVGVYSPSKWSSSHLDVSDRYAEDGLCFFYMWGVVPRLNQGAYHPSHNPMGSARWKNVTIPTNSQEWYGNTGDITSAIQAFTVYDNTVTGVTGKADWSGGLVSTATGRPDSKFYDAIYSSGQGGVIDYRMSAWDMGSKEEASKVFQKVVNGSYRGKEKLKVTRFYGSPWTASSTPGFQKPLRKADSSDFVGVKVGDTLAVLASDETIWQPCYVSGFNADNELLYRAIDGSNVTRAASTAGMVSLITEDSNTSVSGEFTMVDVIGDPAGILATPQLANGWLGSWNPKFHTNYNTIVGTRKNVLGTVSRRYTTNLGTDWGFDSPAWDSVKNTFISSTVQPTGRVEIWEYTAFAKQTKESVNKPVFNGSAGVGGVWADMEYSIGHASLLAESIIGKVLTSGSGNNPSYGHFSVQDAYIHPVNGDFVGYLPVAHTPINLSAPTNDSPAVKALWYQTSDNQQAGLNFAYNELVYNAGGAAGNEWGDTTSATTYSNAYGQIRIVDGVSTYTNSNGDVCLYGTNELAIPYGYTKNQARAGEQTIGVDL